MAALMLMVLFCFYLGCAVIRACTALLLLLMAYEEKGRGRGALSKSNVCVRVALSPSLIHVALMLGACCSWQLEVAVGRQCWSQPTSVKRQPRFLEKFSEWAKDISKIREPVRELFFYLG